MAQGKKQNKTADSGNKGQIVENAWKAAGGSKEGAKTARKTYTAVSKMKKPQRIIVIVIVLIIAAVFIAATLIPSFGGWLYGALGIEQPQPAVGNTITSSTKVHFIDVGQGDAILLEQSGQFALLDAGPPEGRDNLIAYMKSAGVEKLAYVVMTHPHADHIGGMQKVVETFLTEKVLLPDFALSDTPTSSLFKNLLQSLVDNDVQAETMQKGAQYTLGSGSITVLANGLESNNLNLMCPAILFEAEGFRFLDTGDAEKANEQAILDSGVNVKADVFSAGHHGSSTSNTKKFLSAVNPQLVVVSCGKDNSYGHPHKEAMNAFESVSATVLRTDIGGSIAVGLDENGKIVYAATNDTQETAAAA